MAIIAFGTVALSITLVVVAMILCSKAEDDWSDY